MLVKKNKKLIFMVIMVWSTWKGYLILSLTYLSINYHYYFGDRYFIYQGIIQKICFYIINITLIVVIVYMFCVFTNTKTKIYKRTLSHFTLIVASGKAYLLAPLLFENRSHLNGQRIFTNTIKHKGMNKTMLDCAEYNSSLTYLLYVNCSSRKV